MPLQEQPNPTTTPAPTLTPIVTSAPLSPTPEEVPSSAIDTKPHALLSSNTNEVFEYLKEEFFKANPKSKKDLKIAIDLAEQLKKDDQKILSKDQTEWIFNSETTLKTLVSSKDDLTKISKLLEMLAVIGRIAEQTAYLNSLALGNKSFNFNAETEYLLDQITTAPKKRGEEKKQKDFSEFIEILGNFSYNSIFTMHPDYAGTLEYRRQELEFIKTIDQQRKELAEGRSPTANLNQKLAELFAATSIDFKPVAMDQQAETVAWFHEVYADGALEFYNSALATAIKLYPEQMKTQEGFKQFLGSISKIYRMGDWLKDKDGKPTSTADANKKSFAIRKQKIVQDHIQKLDNIISQFKDKPNFSKAKEKLETILKNLKDFAEKLEADPQDNSLPKRTTKVTIDDQESEVIGLVNQIDQVIDENFIALNREPQLLELLSGFSFYTASSYYSDMRPRQEAEQHIIALEQILSSFTIPENLDLQDQNGQKITGNIKYKELDPTNRKILLLYILNNENFLKKIAYEVSKLSPEKAAIAHRELANFTHYKSSSSKLLQIAQWQEPNNFLEIFVLAELAGISKHEMQLTALLEQPELWQQLIDDPEQVLGEFFQDDTFKEYFAKHGFRILLPFSDIGKDGGPVQFILLKELGIKKVEEYLTKKSEELTRRGWILPNGKIALRVDAGSGVEAARGGPKVALQFSDVTHQNFIVTSLKRPEAQSSFLAQTFIHQHNVNTKKAANENSPRAKELESLYISRNSLTKKESSKVTKEEKIILAAINRNPKDLSLKEKLLAYLLQNFCLKVQQEFDYLKNSQNGYRSNLDALVNLATHAQTTIAAATVHRLQRKDPKSQSTTTDSNLEKLRKPDNIVTNIVEITESRAITVDKIMNNMLAVNKYLGLLNSLKELGINEEDQKLLLKLSPGFNHLRTVIAHGINIANPTALWLEFDEKDRPKNREELEEFSKNLDRKKNDKSCSDIDKAKFMAARFQLEYDKIIEDKFFNVAETNVVDLEHKELSSLVEALLSVVNKEIKTKGLDKGNENALASLVHANSCFHDIPPSGEFNRREPINQKTEDLAAIKIQKVFRGYSVRLKIKEQQQNLGVQ